MKNGCGKVEGESEESVVVGVERKDKWKVGVRVRMK